MGIEHKHAYRFGYLKSEQWKTVRSAALARDEAKCQICGYKSVFNDAHHRFYPINVWRTKVQHLIILCRLCHELVHELLPKSESLNQGCEQFRKVADLLHTWRLATIKQDEERRTEVLQHIIEQRQKIPKLPANGCVCCRVSSQTVEYRFLFPQHEQRRWKLCEQCFEALRLLKPMTFKQLRAALFTVRQQNNVLTTHSLSAKATS